MTRRMFQVLLAVGMAGLISCTATEDGPDEDRAPDGEWAPEPLPGDDGNGPTEPASIGEPAEPNDVGDAPGAFALPAIGDDAVSLRGCFTPTAGANGRENVDRDAFAFDVAGPAYIDVSAAGSGGAFAGMLLESDDPSLADDGWIRIAADPGATGVARRVFLPKAGTYYLVASDARSIISGVAMGGRDACYELTVAQLAIPAATESSAASFSGTATGDPLFYRYRGDTGGHIAYGELQYAHPGAVSSIVTMRNGEYVASAAGAGGIASARMPTHGAQDNVVLVVDSMFRILPGTRFDVAIDDTGLVADPGDGTPVVFTQGPNQLFAEMYFYAKRGELVNLRFLSDGGRYDVSVVRPDGLGTMAEVCQWCSAHSSTWMSVFQTGLHRIRVSNHTAPYGAAFNVAFTRTHVPAWTMDVGSTRASDLSRANRAWYLVDVAAGETIGFTVRPMSGDSFDAAEIRIYDAARAGQIDSDNPYIASVPLLHRGESAGEPMTRIFYESKTLLVSVEDTGNHDGDEMFEMSLSRQN